MRYRYTLDIRCPLWYNINALYKTIMRNYIVVVSTPVDYTGDQKKELESAVRLAMDDTGVLVIPEDVSVMFSPRMD